MENSISNTSDMSTLSMYYDAESTISSVAFKTLDINDDISFNDGNKSIIASQNSTLEANDENKFSKLQMQTVMRSNNLNASPLRPHNKNIQEFCVLSSTPTKAQIKRSVEVIRGSDLERCTIDFENLQLVEPGAIGADNINSESEASTLSASSCVETTNNSVIEQNIEKLDLTINNNADEDVMDEVSTPRIDDLIKSNQNESENTSRTSVGTLLKEITKEVNEIKLLVNGKSIIYEDNLMPQIMENADDENYETDDNDEIVQSVEKNKKLKYSSKKYNPKASRLSIPRRSIISQQPTRKTICEPNLKTNRPSRIGTVINAATKRHSLLPRSLLNHQTATDELPKLLDKMKKLTSKNRVDGGEVNMKLPTRNIKAKPTFVDDVQKPSRYSSIPTRNDKIILNKRTSVGMKPTLSSPSHRTQRRTGTINIGQTRKSFAQGASGDHADYKAISATLLQKTLVGGRKSIMPSIRETTVKNKATAPKSSFARDSLKLFEAKLNAGTQPKQKTTLQQIKLGLPYSCSICGNKFSVKSLLNAHKQTHQTDGKKLSPSTSSTNLNNQCKYCDKKFAIVRALHIHLMENCPKIPPIEKRKLRYTEMDHVEKAKVPTFTNSANNSANISTNNSTSLTIANMKNVQKQQQLFKTAAISSDDSSSEKREFPPYDTFERRRMAPPKSTKLKKKTAHSGVRRTPNKSLACHLCKKSFINVIDYTTHILTLHSTKSSGETTNDNTTATTDSNIINNINDTFENINNVLTITSTPSKIIPDNDGGDSTNSDNI